VNLDPKQDEVVDLVVDAIRATGSVDRVCVGSFSGKRLRRVRQLLGPRVCTSLGPSAIARLRLGSLRVPAGQLPSPCVQVPVRAPGRIPIVDRRFVTEVHRRGMQVHVWTVDDPDEMHRLLDLGVDGLMTDRPAVLKDVLVARGEWFGS
jgi:glycerophosphoryl diester phosphodiesterase